MYTETNEEIVIDLRQLAAALVRKARRIVWVTILCAGLALLTSVLFIAPRYQSAVMFFVSGCDVDSGMVVLETGQTLQAVLQRSGMEHTQEELSRMLSAKAVRDTEFFRVTVAGTDAREVKCIADAVAEVLPLRISEVIGDVVIRVADQAAISGEPVSPDHAKNTIIGALIGFTGMSGIICLREIFTGQQAGLYSPGKKQRRSLSRRRK